MVGIKNQESQKGKVLRELTHQDYETMHRVREFWINRALKGGTDFNVEDIRPDINYLYKAVGDMHTDKPQIFVFDSYAAMQLGYNLLKVATESKTELIRQGRNIFETATMDRIWDLIWYGQDGQSIHEGMEAHSTREVQEKVWEGTARISGDSVGMGVWDVVRQNVNTSVSEMTWDNLWKFIGVNNNRRSPTAQKVWTDVLTQVSQYTSHSFDDILDGTLTEILERNTTKSNKLSFVDHFVGTGNWAGWMAFYDFFYQAGYIDENNGVTEEWLRFRSLLVDRGIWTMECYDDCVLVCKLPQRVRRDEVQKQLHSLNGPAVEWFDGTGQYFIYGINFSQSFIDDLGTPPALWNKIASGEIRWDELFSIRNIEQRRVAIRVYGPEKIMKDAKAVMIDGNKRGYQLYKITPKVAVRGSNGKITFKEDDRRINTDDNHTLIPEMRIAYYKDPSTSRWYHSFVPTNINRIDEAMAWKLQITPEEYKNELKVEA